MHVSVCVIVSLSFIYGKTVAVTHLHLLWGTPGVYIPQLISQCITAHSLFPDYQDDPIEHNVIWYLFLKIKFTHYILQTIM